MVLLYNTVNPLLSLSRGGGGRVYGKTKYVIIYFAFSIYLRSKYPNIGTAYCRYFIYTLTGNNFITFNWIVIVCYILSYSIIKSI